MMIAKQDKLKNMWRDLPAMKKEDIMSHLQGMKVTMSYEEIVEALAKTHDDLSVADRIFSTYQVDDTNSIYPKEFIDEAITKIARMESFAFTHYGLISQDLLALHDVLIPTRTRATNMQELFTKLFQLCKKFHLDNYDALVYSIHDSLDLSKEFLTYLSLLQSFHEADSDHELIRMSDRFLQTFPQMNPWLEEQISYAQASAYIRLKSSRGEKMFQTMLKEYPDSSEVIYRYGSAYASLDQKKMQTIFTRYKNEVDKSSEFCRMIQKLSKNSEKNKK